MALLLVIGGLFSRKDLNKPDPDQLASRLMKLADTDRFQEGLELAETELPKITPNSKVNYALEHLYYGINDLDRTKYYAQKTLETDPGNEMAIRIYISICRDFDDNEAGYTAGKAWIARNSHGTDVYKDLAMVADDAGHTDEAYQFATEAFRRKPDHPRIASVYFYYACQNQPVATTLSEVDKWLTNKTADAFFWAQLGKGLSDAGEWKEAMPRLQRALDMGSADDGVVTELLSCYRNLNDREGANTFFEKYKTTRTPSAGAWRNLGAIYSDASDYKKALESFRQSQRIESDNPSTMANVVFTLYDLKRSQEGIDEGNRWLATSKKKPTDLLHRAMGNAYFAKSLWEDAEKHYRAALVLNPKSIRAARELISTLDKQDRANEAVEFGTAWRLAHPEVKEETFDQTLAKVRTALAEQTQIDLLMNKEISFDFALYFAPEPKSDPEQAFNELIPAKYSQHFLGRASNSAGDATVSARWVELAKYLPPSPQTYKYAAKDIEIEIGSSIALSKRVFVLTFTAAQRDLVSINQQASMLVADLADATQGIPWDNECRLLYSAKAWRKARVDTWTQNLPDVRTHVNMHAYRNPELMRIITLGMRKFGLPDLVINEVASGTSRSAGNTINACAQLLLEGAVPNHNRLELDLSRIRHASMRTEALENPGEGAIGRVRTTFRLEKAEDGDPDNTLWRLEFPSMPGATNTERHSTAFATLFGATDPIVKTPSGDQAMKEASARARTNFFAQEAAFRREFQPNERLLVKTPFIIGDTKEYMWVEVTSWKEKMVEGILANDSYYDKSLKSGKRVSIPLDDIYDYIHYKPDGTEEGNETGKVLKQRGK